MLTSGSCHPAQTADQMHHEMGVGHVNGGAAKLSPVSKRWKTAEKQLSPDSPEQNWKKRKMKDEIAPHLSA